MGKTWLSLNKNGQHCEMICAAECLIPLSNIHNSNPYSYGYNSRFATGSYRAFDCKFKTHVQNQFLSPKTVYIANLVFKIIKKNHRLSKWSYGAPTYITVGRNPSVLYFADAGEDGWLMAKLYKFTSTCRSVDIEIIFESLRSYDSSVLVVEGIEFQPVEKVDHADQTDRVQRTTKTLLSFFRQRVPNQIW